MDLQTKDTILNGQIICHQNTDGYRFSIDSVLIAHFIDSYDKATLLDLGCGCGVIGLIVLGRNWTNTLSVEGLEIQDNLFELAKKNVRKNNFADRMNITKGDIREIRSIYRSESFSHIICNPPFYSPGSGRFSQNNENIIARHQTAVTLEDIMKACRYALKNKGSLSIIYPAHQLVELITSSTKYRLQPKEMRLVYSYPEAEKATLVMINLIKNGGIGLKVYDPLFVYRTKNGDYSNEVKIMYGE